MKYLKPIFFLLLLFTFSAHINAQSAFKKKYIINGTIYYENAKNKKSSQSKTVDEPTSDSLNLKVVNSKKELKVDTLLVVSEKHLITGNSTTIVKDSSYTFKYSETLSKDTVLLIKSKFYANVKFDEDKVWINSWLYKGNSAPFPRDAKVYYQLNNRQQLRLRYRQWTVSPITVPIKVQFGRDSITKFSAGVSLGGLVGYSIGWTKFTHRNKIENFERSHEITVGGLFSFQGIEIDLGNETTRETVATSIGIGVTYAYDKINFGLTGGLDYAHGYGAKKWTFQGRPWLGIVFGYSLFD